MKYSWADRALVPRAGCLHWMQTPLFFVQVSSPGGWTADPQVWVWKKIVEISLCLAAAWKIVKKKLIVYKISHCQWTSLPDSLHIILTSKWKIRTQQWVCACVFAFRSNTNLITHHSLKFSLVFLRLYSWSKSTFPPPVPVCSQHGRTLTTVVTSVGCRSSLVDKQEQRWNPLLNLQSFKVISEINFRR